MKNWLLLHNEWYVFKESSITNYWYSDCKMLIYSKKMFFAPCRPRTRATSASIILWKNISSINMELFWDNYIISDLLSCVKKVLFLNDNLTRNIFNRNGPWRTDGIRSLLYTRGSKISQKKGRKPSADSVKSNQKCLRISTFLSSCHYDTAETQFSARDDTKWNDYNILKSKVVAQSVNVVVT